jgi:hypothetical protein
MLIKFYGFHLLFVSKIQVSIGLTGLFFQHSKKGLFFVSPEIVNNFRRKARNQIFDQSSFFCFERLAIIDKHWFYVCFFEDRNDL